MSPLLLLFAVLPGFLVSYAVFRADKYEQESAAALMLCFALGAVATLPAIAIEKWDIRIVVCVNSDFGKLY